MKKKNFKYLNLGVLMVSALIVCAQPKSTKRGEAYGGNSEADMQAISKGITWWYNWDIKPEQGVINTYKAFNVEYVTMAWSGGTSLSLMSNYLAIDTSVKFLLGYNEPNFTQQANMTPTQAATAWPQLESVAKKYGLKLVSPAVNDCGACVTEWGITFTNPVQYLDSFFTACKNCQVDYIAVHWYACDGGSLTSYLSSFKKYNKPIWLTEFSCSENGAATLQTQENYLFQAVDILENDPDVFRYSWFTGRSSSDNNSLFTSTSGQLSALGNIYVNMPTHDTDFYYTIPTTIDAAWYTRMNGSIQLQTTSDAVIKLTDLVSTMFNVGYIAANNWLSYNIIVPDSAQYNLNIRIAGNTAGSLSVYSDSTLLTTIQTPATGGWQNWQTISAKINLPQGKHQLKFFVNTNGFNLNWFEISDTSPTSVNELVKNDNVTITPNPLTEDRQFAIKINGVTSLNMKIELFDMTGHLILSKENNSNNSAVFNVGNDVAPGIYLLNIKMKNNVIYRKIIIP